jgi:electron transport complex protein RnfG
VYEMKDVARYALILGLICLIAGVSLAGMNSLTRARIAHQGMVEEEASLKEVLPDAERFEAVRSREATAYYRAFDKEGNPAGIAFKASAKGYSSDIETMVGLDPSGRITAIKVLAQNETPGLGSNVADAPFCLQFRGSDPYSLEGVQAITGATISSAAVINSVKARAQKVREMLR